MTSFKVVTHERFIEMIEILPPSYQDHKGFLSGGPWTHRLCTVSRKFLPAYTAFVSYGDCYYESNEAITIPEFLTFDVRWLSS